MNQQQLNFAIMPPALTIAALRDSGYKNTDHALAELIDNSIDAEASLIELIAVETPPDPGERYARARVTEIAVADNGTGMNATTLRRALRFGDGTRRDRSKRNIGRFGIGLPNASISQCRRVDIWTWQNGADNALHCHLDLDEVAEGATDVPEPIHDPVPDRWRSVADSTSESSGTLVVWSNLDRVNWRGGRKTLERTAELCGRVYRNFIAETDNPVTILLTLAENTQGTLSRQETSERCEPNDPLYLMTPSSTPEPFDKQPMFQLFNERTWPISVNDQQGEVHVQCSLVKKDAIVREDSSVEWPGHYKDAGHSPWGKHAGRHQGVSIVRADRELELSHAWINSYDPRERWWAVEVKFDPLLDDIFGVTNNKQHAHTFVDGAGFSLEEETYPGESPEAVRERLEESGDKRAHLIEIWDWIGSQISRMRAEREKMTKGSRGQSRHPDTATIAEDAATAEINEQAERGETGRTDQQPSITAKEKEAEITRTLTEREVANPEESASIAVANNRRVLIDAGKLGHRDAFFDVESVNDTIVVLLNQEHPVYPHLFESLTARREEATPEELADHLQSASYAIEMLLFAWSRYEDKASIETSRQLEDVRMDWGREARKFLDSLSNG